MSPGPYLPEPPEENAELERVVAEPRSRPILVAFVLAVALGLGGFLVGFTVGGSPALDTPGCVLKVYGGLRTSGDFADPKVWAELQAIADKNGSTIAKGSLGPTPILVEQDCTSESRRG